MSGAAPKRTFELITEEPPAATSTQPAAPPTDQTLAARQLLFTALRALSQRALTAVTNLFSLFLVISVALLLERILDDPTPNRLAGVGGYATFCILIDSIRRRTK